VGFLFLGFKNFVIFLIEKGYCDKILAFEFEFSYFYEIFLLGLKKSCVLNPNSLRVEGKPY